MKVVIDTKMERHMLEVSETDVKDVAKRIMDRMKDDKPFIGLYHVEKDKAIILRKSEIMAIFVYPDELHDYDKATIDMIQGAVIQKEKESEEEEPDIDVEMHFKDGSVVKAYTDGEGRMVFKPQGRGEKDV